MKLLILNKWEHDTHTYHEEVFDVDTYNLKTWCDDMDELIHCPHCLQELPYGASYTSLEYHTPVGIGYCVCGKCYEKEYKRKYKDY